MNIIDRGHEFDFALIDCGNGISEKNQQRIFDPFFTDKDVGDGSGMGLSISRSTALSHRGKLSLDTKSITLDSSLLYQSFTNR